MKNESKRKKNPTLVSVKIKKSFRKSFQKAQLTGRVDPHVLDDHVVERAGPAHAAGAVRRGRDDAADGEVFLGWSFFLMRKWKWKKGENLTKRGVFFSSRSSLFPLLVFSPDQTVGTPLGGDSPLSAAHSKTCQSLEPARTVILRSLLLFPRIRGVETPRSESSSTAAVAGTAALVTGGPGKGP